MGNIGESLQRKLGPLPVWAWALGAGILLYLIRARKGGGAAQAAGSTGGDQAQLISAEGTAVAQDTQPVTTLSTGEAVYDPNTGYLSAPNPDPTTTSAPAAPPPPSTPSSSTNSSILGLIYMLSAQPSAPSTAKVSTKKKAPPRKQKKAAPKTTARRRPRTTSAKVKK